MLDVDEPFAGLFTQGMVTHETYRDADGSWLYARRRSTRGDGGDGARTRHGASRSTIGRDREDVEVEEEHGRSRTTSSTATAPTPRAGSCCRTLRPSATWNGPRPASPAPGASPSASTASPKASARSRRSSPDEPPTDAARTLRRATHRAIASVTAALDGFSFNVAVARLYELAAALADAEKSAAADPADASLAAARAEALDAAIRLSAPMMPHLAEAMNALLRPDGETLVAQMPWPEADAALAAVAEVTIGVQVMGKLRGTVTMAPGSPADQVLAAAEREPNVARLLEGKRVVKRIHVPDRIVNFVVAG